MSILKTNIPKEKVTVSTKKRKQYNYDEKHIIITKALHEEIKQYAKDHGMTIKGLIRQAVKEYIKK